MGWPLIPTLSDEGFAPDDFPAHLPLDARTMRSTAGASYLSPALTTREQGPDANRDAARKTRSRLAQGQSAGGSQVEGRQIGATVTY